MDGAKVTQLNKTLYLGDSWYTYSERRIQQNETTIKGSSGPAGLVRYMSSPLVIDLIAQINIELGNPPALWPAVIEAQWYCCNIGATQPYSEWLHALR